MDVYTVQETRFRRVLIKGTGYDISMSMIQWQCRPVSSVEYVQCVKYVGRAIRYVRMLQCRSCLQDPMKPKSKRARRV